MPSVGNAGRIIFANDYATIRQTAMHHADIYILNFELAKRFACIHHETQQKKRQPDRSAKLGPTPQTATGV